MTVCARGEGFGVEELDVIDVVALRGALLHNVVLDVQPVDVQPRHLLHHSAPLLERHHARAGLVDTRERGCELVTLAHDDRTERQTRFVERLRRV